MERLDLQRFGENPEAAPVETAGREVTDEGSAEPSGGGRASFRQLIAGEYRQDYEQAVGQRIQAAIQQRFKNQQDYKKQMDAMQPILQTLGGRYGLNAEDIAGISDRLRQENPGAPAPEETVSREENSGKEAPAGDPLEKYVQRVNAQAEALRREFPGFDLAKEMDNPAFMRMTSPGVGMSVRDAFFAVHSQELQRDSMQFAALRAGERIAASVMAGASRPRENGMDASGSADRGVDVQSMDRKTRAEYRRRIRNGEKINFMDQL